MELHSCFLSVCWGVFSGNVTMTSVYGWVLWILVKALNEEKCFPQPCWVELWKSLLLLVCLTLLCVWRANVHGTAFKSVGFGSAAIIALTWGAASLRCVLCVGYRRWRWKKGFLSSPDASRWELMIWNGAVAPCVVVPNKCTLWMLSDVRWEARSVKTLSGSSEACIVALLSTVAFLGRDKGEKLWNWF